MCERCLRLYTSHFFWCIYIYIYVALGHVWWRLPTTPKQRAHTCSIITQRIWRINRISQSHTHRFSFGIISISIACRLNFMLHACSWCVYEWCASIWFWWILVAICCARLLQNMVLLTEKPPTYLISRFFSSSFAYSNRPLRFVVLLYERYLYYICRTIWNPNVINKQMHRYIHIWQSRSAIDTAR